MERSTDTVCEYGSYLQADRDNRKAFYGMQAAMVLTRQQTQHKPFWSTRREREGTRGREGTHLTWKALGIASQNSRIFSFMSAWGHHNSPTQGI